MKKSTEERLADIESGITRLTNMQDCLFNMVFFMRKASVLSERIEQTFIVFEESWGSFHRREDRGIVLLFGGFAVAGVAISMYFLFSATQDFALKVSSLIFLLIALALLLFSQLELYQAWKQHRAVRKELTQTKEVIESAKEAQVAINDAIARILVEWKELVPNDSVSESINDAPESKDSPNRN